MNLYFRSDELESITDNIFRLITILINWTNPIDTYQQIFQVFLIIVLMGFMETFSVLIFSLMSKSIFTHTKILLWHIFSAVALQIPQKNAVWPTLYIETLITQWFIFDNLALFNAGIVLMLFDARLGSSFQKWGLEVSETTFLLKSITILSWFYRLH